MLFFMKNLNISGMKKEHKPKLLSPDIFRWGRGLPREGVGAKKFNMSLETKEINFYGRDIPGDFAGISRKRPKSLRKKKFVSNFWPLTLSFFSLVFSKIPRKTPKTPRLFLTLRTLRNPVK